MTVSDEKGSYTLKVSEKEFLVEGNLISDQPRADELCYLPVFMSKLGYNDTW